MDRNNCLDLRVVEKAHLKQGGSQFLLRFENPGWNARPGQFAMVRPPSFGLDLVWGRPFSIADADDGSLTFFIRDCGRGTGRIAALEPGDTATVWGPLGSFFSRDEHAPVLLLAGGIGLAPFLGYVRNDPAPERIELFLGHTLGLEEYPIHLVPETVRLSTFHQRTMDDLATFIDLLAEKIRRHEDGLVQACGPEPYLRTVARLAAEAGAVCELSLENRMACGVGACLGCVTKPADGGLPVQSCTSGPVFWASEVLL